MCRSPWDSFYLFEWFGRREGNVLWGAASWNCSKQLTVSLGSSHPAFTPGVPLKSFQCNHTVVLAQQPVGRNSILFYQRNHKVSIAVHVFLMRMLASISVDEILLPRYMNWSTYFRGLPSYEEMEKYIPWKKMKLYLIIAPEICIWNF